MTQREINRQIVKVLEEIVTQRFSRANLEELKEMVEKDAKIFHDWSVP